MATPILVIDANREFGILIRQSLEDSGRYQVTLANSGEDAIERAYAQDFELAIVDFGLPNMPGAELVRRLRAIRPDLSVVALPGGAETSPDLAGVSVEGVISRPFYLPELPAILEQALQSQPLTGQIQWEEEEVELSPQVEREIVDPAPSQPAHEPEPGRITSDEALNVHLLAALEASQALACLLLHEGKVVAHAGLRADQARELAGQLRERQADDPDPGTVVAYTRLASEGEDRLLYTTPISRHERVSLLFDASVPFGQIRRAASDFLYVLRGEEPPPEPSSDWLDRAARSGGRSDRPPASPPVRAETGPPQPGPGPQVPPVYPGEAELPAAADAGGPAASEPGLQAPAESSPEGLQLPPDWLPDESLSAAQQELLEELTEVDLPPPDPEPAPSLASESKEHLSLPRDWIPSETPPDDYMPFLDEPARSTEGGSSAQPEQPAAQPSGHRLAFTAVLVPRFPEHQLSGPLAQQVQQWTQRFCLAWDWRAERVQVERDHLQFQVELVPESAPAAAIEQLQRDLSQRILDEYPQFRSDLPSGRFWARDYLLKAGDPPAGAEIEGFVERTRRAQGLAE